MELATAAPDGLVTIAPPKFALTAALDTDPASITHAFVLACGLPLIAPLFNARTIAQEMVIAVMAPACADMGILEWTALCQHAPMNVWAMVCVSKEDASVVTPGQILIAL